MLLKWKNYIGHGWENKICYGNHFLKLGEGLYFKVKYMVENKLAHLYNLWLD